MTLDTPTRPITDLEARLTSAPAEERRVIVGPRVLLVDDNAELAASVAIALSEEGVAAACATSAAGAKEMFTSRKFDAVVIDTPPRHDDTLRAALMVADVALLPCGPSPLDAWALAASLELVGQAKGLRPGLKVAAVVNRKIARTAVGAHARGVLTDAGLVVLGTEVHQRVAYLECMAAGLGVAQYAPGTTAAAEVVASAPS